ncbi:MAG: hypothetical protein U0Z75_09215 [Deinococcaceae bacterium]
MVLLKPFKLISILTLTVSLSACSSTQQEKPLPQLQPSSFAGVRGMTPKNDYAYGLALSPTGDRLYVGGGSDGLPGSDNLDAFVGSLSSATGSGLLTVFQKSGLKPNDDADIVKDVTVGPQSGAVFISGSTDSKVFFEPNTTYNTGFVARLNGNGGTTWHHQTDLFYMNKIVTSVESGQEYLYVLLSKTYWDIGDMWKGSYQRGAFIQKFNADTGAIVETYTPWLDAARNKSFPNCKVSVPEDMKTCELRVEDFAVSKAGELHVLTSIYTPHASLHLYTLGIMSYKTSGLFDTSTVVADDILNEISGKMALFQDPQSETSNIYISYTGDGVDWSVNEIYPVMRLARWQMNGKSYTRTCEYSKSMEYRQRPEEHHLAVDNAGNAVLSTMKVAFFGTPKEQIAPFINQYSKMCDWRWLAYPGDTNSRGITDLITDPATGDVFVSGNTTDSGTVGGIPKGGMDFWIHRLDNKTGKIIW